MLEILIGIFAIYSLLKIYVSYSEIGYVKQERESKPILMEKETYLKAADYAVEKEKLSMVESVFELGLFVFWMLAGMQFLQNFVGMGSGLGAVLFVLLFLLINGVVTLPLELYKTFSLDKRYGFTQTTVGTYIKDTLKSLVMLIVLGGGVIYAVAWIFESVASWWIWAFMFLFGIIVLINALYPTLIAPIFNKFKPLDDENLNAKIQALLGKVGFKSSGVFVMDASKRDARLNAYFGGLGKTKRVVLFDTLIEKLKESELLAVLGHELGHFAHNDIVKNIVIMGAILFFAFFLFGHIPQDVFESIQVVEDPAIIMILFLLLTPVLFFFLMPIVSFISRKNEYAADEFGSELGGKENLVQALLKLVNENKSFPKAHPLYIFFYYSHPPLVERLKALDYDINQIPESVGEISETDR